MAQTYQQRIAKLLMMKKKPAKAEEDERIDHRKAEAVERRSTRYVWREWQVRSGLTRCLREDACEFVTKPAQILPRL